MKDDFLKKVLDRLSVCLTYAGEDIEDFLWVLDQDERDGYAPRRRRAPPRHLPPDQGPIRPRRP